MPFLIMGTIQAIFLDRKLKKSHITFCYDIYKWSFSAKCSLLYFLSDLESDMTENSKSRLITNSTTLTGNLLRQEMKDV